VDGVGGVAVGGVRCRAVRDSQGAEVSPVALRVVVGLVVAGIVASAVAWFLLSRPPDRGPDADGDRPEDVALAYVEAKNARDFDTMWTYGSDYEHDRRSRADYVEFWEAASCPEPCTAPPVVAEGTDYEVIHVLPEGPWSRVGIRWTPPTGDPGEIEVLVEQADDRYAVTATGPEGFDLSDDPYGVSPRRRDPTGAATTSSASGSRGRTTSVRGEGAVSPASSSAMSRAAPMASTSSSESSIGSSTSSFGRGLCRAWGGRAAHGTICWRTVS